MEFDKEFGQLAVILLALFSRGIKTIIEKKMNTSPKRQKEKLQAEKKIQEIISNIQIKLDLCRVGLIQYHNGNKDFNGVGFNNASMRYEVVTDKRKVERIMSSFQNVPVSTVINMLIELNRTNKGYVVHSDEDNDEQGHTAKYYGVKRAYNFRLGEDISKGVLTCVFTKDRHLTDEDIKFIKSQIVGIKLATKNLKYWTLLGLPS
jgi:hypothetical protein